MHFFSDYDLRQEILTPNDGYHYFFGYYDLHPDDGTGRHLCHRVPFMDRLPTAEDTAEIGYVKDRVFVKIGSTTAWNFQQGALLQFHPTEPDTVFYNVFEDGAFRTVKHAFRTDQKTYTDRAVATVSPDGKWGISIQFGRIFDFRPGYGYAGCIDPYRSVATPHEDGAFLTDLETGHSKQILFYDTLAPIAGFERTQKILINHVNFNPTGDRYVMLVRNFAGSGERWSTSMVVGDRNGNAHAVLTKTVVSHYYWANEKDIIVIAKVGDVLGLFRIDTDTGYAEEYDIPYCHDKNDMDIHCILSPNGDYIIGDGYPKEDGCRHVVAYSNRTGRSVTLFRAKTVIPSVVDIRCDLHVRFIDGGKAISYDTTENGTRQIAKISTDALNF